MFYFLPIFGGQKVALSDSAEGWCAAPGLFPSHYPLMYVLFPSHFLGGQKEGIGSGSRPKNKVTFWITPIHRKQKGDQNWFCHLKPSLHFDP